MVIITTLKELIRNSQMKETDSTHIGELSVVSISIEVTQVKIPRQLLVIWKPGLRF